MKYGQMSSVMRNRLERAKALGMKVKIKRGWEYDNPIVRVVDGEFKGGRSEHVFEWNLYREKDGTVYDREPVDSICLWFRRLSVSGSGDVGTWGHSEGYSVDMSFAEAQDFAKGKRKLLTSPKNFKVPATHAKWIKLQIIKRTIS